MAATLNCGNKSTLGNVASVIDESDMVANVDNCWNWAAIAYSFLYLFPLPVSLDAILNYGSLPTEGSVMCKSDMAEKLGL